MGKIIELSDQHYAIMSAAAAERGESVDSMMTRWRPPPLFRPFLSLRLRW